MKKVLILVLTALVLLGSSTCPVLAQRGGDGTLSEDDIYIGKR
jgi:hypothetical protein